MLLFCEFTFCVTHWIESCAHGSNGVLVFAVSLNLSSYFLSYFSFSDHSLLACFAVVCFGKHFAANRAHACTGVFVRKREKSKHKSTTKKSIGVRFLIFFFQIFLSIKTVWWIEIFKTNQKISRRCLPFPLFLTCAVVYGCAWFAEKFLPKQTTAKHADSTWPNHQ